MEYSKNRYGDIIITNPIKPSEINKLIEIINESPKDTFWLEVEQSNSSIISEILKLEFNFHHTEENILTLVRTQKEEIFPFASHYIGVGGVVIHENKILTVIEKFDKAFRKNFYKLPGGFLNKDEHIRDAAIREVYEETGIKTQFDYLFAIRHNHKSRYFNKSNIYFVVNLKPINFDIEIDNYEIDKAVWMDVDEFLNHEDIYEFNKEIVRNVVNNKNKLSLIEKNCNYEKLLYETYI